MYPLQSNIFMFMRAPVAEKIHHLPSENPTKRTLNFPPVSDSSHFLFLSANWLLQILKMYRNALRQNNILWSKEGQKSRNTIKPTSFYIFIYHGFLSQNYFEYRQMKHVIKGGNILWMQRQSRSHQFWHWQVSSETWNMKSKSLWRTWRVTEIIFLFKLIL